MRLVLAIGNPPFLPYMHLIGESPAPHIRHLFAYKNAAQLRNDLDLLLRHFVPVSLNDLIDAQRRGSKLPANAMHLTFDDGMREIHDVVAPILAGKGIPATFFISSAFIDNKHLFYRHFASVIASKLGEHPSPTAVSASASLLGLNTASVESVQQATLSVTFPDRRILDQLARLLSIDHDEFLSSERPYLTTDNIHSLIRAGFTIGAHGIEHEDYSFLSLDEQLETTIRSIDFIQQMFTLSYRVFSFPFSDMSISELFYQRIAAYVDLIFGIGNMKTDIVPFSLQRTNIESPGIDTATLLKMHYCRYAARKLTGKGTVHRLKQ